jgi:isoamyl acetate esterase
MSWHPSPGPLNSSLEYFYLRMQPMIHEMLAKHRGDPEWLTAAWVLKGALSRIIIEDNVEGPFPLCHLDLHHGNLLFDDEYNLASVIDWSNAQAAPLEQFACFPELIVAPAMPEEEKRLVEGFRDRVIRALEEMETQQSSKSRRQISKAEVDQTGALTNLAKAKSHQTEVTGTGTKRARADQLKAPQRPTKRARSDQLETPESKSNGHESDQIGVLRTRLSPFIASNRAEITYRYCSSNTRQALWMARMVSELMYGDSITWDQLKQVYGPMPFF